MSTIETQKIERAEDELFVPIQVHDEITPVKEKNKRKQKRPKTNAVTKFDSALNTTALKGFTAFEMDVFWSMIQKARDQGTKEITIKYDEFERMTHFDRREKDAFHEVMISLSDKLDTLTIKRESSSFYEKLWLFQKFRLDKIDRSVTLSCNPQFDFILNSIGMGKHFTRMELDIYFQLKGIYTKELYRHLMQFRDKSTGIGYWAVNIEEFRLHLGIPESYRMSHIQSRVLNVAEKEFFTKNEDGEPIFEKFEVEKFKEKGKGNKVSRLVITFKEYRKPLPKVSLYNWAEGEPETFPS